MSTTRRSSHSSLACAVPPGRLNRHSPTSSTLVGPEIGGLISTEYSLCSHARHVSECECSDATWWLWKLEWGCCGCSWNKKSAFCWVVKRGNLLDTISNEKRASRRVSGCESHGI